jgi:hypothetical protein
LFGIWVVGLAASNEGQTRTRQPLYRFVRQSDPFLRIVIGFFFHITLDPLNSVRFQIPLLKGCLLLAQRPQAIEQSSSYLICSSKGPLRIRLAAILSSWSSTSVCQFIRSAPTLIIQFDAS